MTATESQRNEEKPQDIQCQFSVEELEDELWISERDIQIGNTYNQSDIKELHPKRK